MQPDELLEWKTYKEKNDPEAHHRLCERYLPDVRRIVSRMAIYIGDGALEREDLVHAGIIGLIDAIERFDPNKAVGFIDFAVKRIRGAVYDELRALDGLSSRLRRQQKAVEKIKQELQHRLLRAPTEEETAEELGLSVDQFRQLQTNVQTVRAESLEMHPEEGVSMVQVLPKVQHWIPDADGFSLVEKAQIVASQIDQLPERTRIVLGLYYREGLTLKEIAQVMNLTESRICQIHAAALNTLHEQLTQIGDCFAPRGAARTGGRHG